MTRIRLTHLPHLIYAVASACALYASASSAVYVAALAALLIALHSLIRACQASDVANKARAAEVEAHNTLVDLETAHAELRKELAAIKSKTDNLSLAQGWAPK